MHQELIKALQHQVAKKYFKISLANRHHPLRLSDVAISAGADHRPLKTFLP